MANRKGAGQATKKKAAKKPAATEPEPEPDPPQEKSPKKPATSKKAGKKRDTSADVPTSPPRRKGRKIETNDSTDSEQSSTPSTPSPKKAKARGASSGQPAARKVQQKKTIASDDMQDSESESDASTPPVTPAQRLKSKGSGPLKGKAPLKKGQPKNKRQTAEDVATTQDTPEVACEVEYMTSSDSDTGVADVETRASQQAKIDKRKGRVRASIKLPAKTEEDLIEFIKDRPLFYDKSLTDFRDTELRNATWREFGDKRKLQGLYFFFPSVKIHNIS